MPQANYLPCCHCTLLPGITEGTALFGSLRPGPGRTHNCLIREHIKFTKRLPDSETRRFRLGVCRVMGVLVVVETPDRAPTDSDTAFARRVQRDRVLAVNPNYVDDE